MIKVLRFGLVAVLGFLILAIPAEAKRRGGGVGFIPIPTGETIVKVLDFPDTPVLRRDDGNYVDLGYKFSRSGDKWVGYIGSSRSYLDLNETQLKALLLIAGVRKLPPVPEKPVAAAIGGGTYSVLLGLGILVILFKFGKGLTRLLYGSARVVNATGQSFVSAAQLPQKSYNDAMGDALDQRIAQAAAAYNSGVAAKPPQASPSYTPQNHVSQQSFGRAPSATFGKRA